MEPAMGAEAAAMPMGARGHLWGTYRQGGAWVQVQPPTATRAGSGSGCAVVSGTIWGNGGQRWQA